MRNKILVVLAALTFVFGFSSVAHADWYAGVVSGQSTYCNYGHTLTYNGDQCPGYQMRYTLEGCNRVYWHRGGTVYQIGGVPPYRYFVAAHLNWLYSHTQRVC